MGTVTVRKIDEKVIRDLKVSAAGRGVSMEQEARDRLSRPLPRSGTSRSSPIEWRPAVPLEELLALGIRPERPIDHKAESDAMYDYLATS